MYTTQAIPGFTGRFPGAGSSRVLALEARPYTYQGQTDFYLQFGRGEGPIGQLPANHWFQFWVYSANTPEQPSQYTGGKFIYPNRATYYPATLENEGYVYLYTMSKSSGTPFGVHPCGGEADRTVGCDSAFLTTVWNSQDGGVDNHITGMNWKLGENLAPEPPIAPNAWTLVKVHSDISGTDPRAVPGHAVYEQWVRRQGSATWVKTSEYFGGVTQVNGQTMSFRPAYTDGFRMFRMPTTIGGTTAAVGDWYDHWMYLDDFVVATSEAALPTYAP